MFGTADFKSSSPSDAASLSRAISAMGTPSAQIGSLGRRSAGGSSPGVPVPASVRGSVVSSLAGTAKPTTPETRSPAMIQPVRTVVTGVEQSEDAIAMSPGDQRSVRTAQEAFENSVHTALQMSAIKTPPKSAKSAIETAKASIQASARAAGLNEEIVPLSVTVAVESSADASAIAAVLAPPTSVERLAGTIPAGSAPKSVIHSAIRSSARGSAKASAELSAQAAASPLPGTLVYTANPPTPADPDMDVLKVLEDYLNTILDVATDASIVGPEEQERIIFAVAHALVIYTQTPTLLGASLPILHFLYAPMTADDARVATRARHSVFVDHMMQLFNIDQESAEQFVVSYTTHAPFVLSKSDLLLLRDLLEDGHLGVRKAECILAKHQEASNEQIGRIYNSPRLAKVDFMYRLRLVDEDVLAPAAAAVAEYLYDERNLETLKREIAGFVEIFRTIKTSADPLGPGLLVATPHASARAL